MATSEKRQEILQAALELIAEHGFHGAPIASIADQAGVGAGTIYRYFENKDVLITVLFQELHDKFHRGLMDGYKSHMSLSERFIRVSTELLRYFITNPLEFRFLEQYFNSPYGVAFRRDRILGKGGDGDLFRMLLEEGVAQQIVKNLPVVVLFALAFGPLLMVARDHILGFVELDDALLVQTVQACWDGVKR
ncbi:MAG: TetR/AcrR family transcriptional regulator [Desulfobulbaceae bacterium]|mgnify:CR=1 FL=1|jgi:AcrR family transcriptional regulator|nr:TetR/AcrR family transcriptional regulator [Desulfobulbaceae bacterium]